MSTLKQFNVTIDIGSVNLSIAATDSDQAIRIAPFKLFPEIAKILESNPIFAEEKPFTVEDTEIISNFPNGMVNWLETYYEIVEKITIERLKDPMLPKLQQIQEAEGSCGFYTLAKKLTDDFEVMNIGREWDGEFFDEVDEFFYKSVKD